MKLTTRIERLEWRAGIGEPLKLTIAFFDGVLDGTISDEEFARYAGALHGTVPHMPVEAVDSIIKATQESRHSQ